MGKYNLNLDDADISEIILNKHGDTVKISADDANLFGRFVRGYGKIVKMSDEMPKKLEEAEKEFEGKEDCESEKKVALSMVRVEFCEKAIAVVDDIFGCGTVRMSFRDEYEAIPDFLPDEYKFVALIEKMAPIMEDIFKCKMDRWEKLSKARMSKYQPQDHKKPQRRTAK